MTASTRNRAAFDFPTRRKRPEVDNVVTSEQSIPEDARPLTLSDQRTLRIQNITERARTLSISSITRIRANSVAASSTLGGSGAEADLPSTPTRSTFSREVLPEYQTVTTVSHDTRVLDTDQPDHVPSIQRRHNAFWRSLVLETGERTRDSYITRHDEPKGAPTNVDQTIVSIPNNLSHSGHENAPYAISPRLSQTRTISGYIDINDRNALQGVTSQAPSSLMLMDIPHTRHSDAALSIAVATRQQSRETPDIELLEPYGPGDLNLYGDFQWLDDGGTEKSSEMDMEPSWEEGLIFPSYSGSSFLDNANSTSGSNLTPPYDDSGKDSITE
ncbi:hypothetical protein MMC15_002635 [Xylographa vitiligo]|nr:hypothetical protein [Xylographa vitiligo]